MGVAVRALVTTPEVVLGCGRSSSGRRGRTRWVPACRTRPLRPQTLHIREGFGPTRTSWPNPGCPRADGDVLGRTRTFSGTPGRPRAKEDVFRPRRSSLGAGTFSGWRCWRPRTNRWSRRNHADPAGAGPRWMAPRASGRAGPAGAGVCLLGPLFPGWTPVPPLDRRSRRLQRSNGAWAVQRGVGGPTGRGRSNGAWAVQRGVGGPTREPSHPIHRAHPSQGAFPPTASPTAPPCPAHQPQPGQSPPVSPPHTQTRRTAKHTAGDRIRQPQSAHHSHQISTALAARRAPHTHRCRLPTPSSPWAAHSCRTTAGRASRRRHGSP
ncbi:Hypothetical protein ACGLYG10_0380 [Actinomyces glycerinitolerans]|uniref:Uncharacterized protein n=1 Tax=Actinomyces glycerinitolerans TaxID=1892869 RepID=A0A1M4RW97_9ACTO|nr:Hypothetical protein ACGLYG10_0380 [Actinomyces glycerinitolerans]